MSVPVKNSYDARCAITAAPQQIQAAYHTQICAERKRAADVSVSRQRRRVPNAEKAACTLKNAAKLFRLPEICYYHVFAQQGHIMTRMVKCIKLGKEAPGMKFAPLPNELGKRIFENVSQEAWDAWTRHQTMLINENRLSLADPRAREYLAQQMENYFFGEGADAVQGYVPK